MAQTTRRTLLATAPVFAAGGTAGAIGPAPSAVAEAYSEYLVVGCDTWPTTQASEMDEEWEQAEQEHDRALAIWFPAHEGAVLRLTEAQSRSLADLEIKLQLACDFLKGDGRLDENPTDKLLLSCLRDLRAIQG